MAGAMFFFGYAPEITLAEGINGRVALTYSRIDTTSTDVTGAATDVSARAFFQQYSLTADKNLFPNLRLFATGMFQKTESTSSTNGVGSWGDTTVKRPYIDLTLRTPVFSAGVNYNSVTTESKALNAPTTTFKSEAYGGNLGLLAQFADPTAPTGYAPFNVQSLAGMVFVTFAKVNPATGDDVAGPGNGLIDVFDPQTGTFHRFATGKNAGGKLKEINSPWGLALSPTNFGAHADQLLVGNFGSGTIMAFDAEGKFQGLLENTHEKPIVIEGLWALAFGNGGRAGRPETLYFTAGPGEESHGLFGSLDLVPEPAKPGKDRGDGGFFNDAPITSNTADFRFAAGTGPKPGTIRHDHDVDPTGQ